MPSSPTARTRLPSGLKAASHDGMPRCSTRRLPASSHRITLPSAEVPTTRVPSRLKSTPWTSSVWPVRTRWERTPPVATTWTLPSSSPSAIRLLSPLNARLSMGTPPRSSRSAESRSMDRRSQRRRPRTRARSTRRRGRSVRRSGGRDGLPGGDLAPRRGVPDHGPALGAAGDDARTVRAVGGRRARRSGRRARRPHLAERGRRLAEGRAAASVGAASTAVSASRTASSASVSSTCSDSSASWREVVASRSCSAALAGRSPAPRRRR